mgnify:CR=1 FL=1
MDNGFQEIDTAIYKTARERYLPQKIKYLIVAESPPAFKGDKPTAYFYFSDVPKADSLFYSMVYALFDFEFSKSIYDREKVLTLFKDNGFYLIDAVDYPINKDKEFNHIDDSMRKMIIKENKARFESHLESLISRGNLDKSTKTILIKETVYSQYSNHPLLNVLNTKYIGFPTCSIDRKFAKIVRELVFNN